MPTVSDLGQKVKAKYPGAYDDVPDAELGTKIKAKYPGQYDDFTDEKAGPKFSKQKGEGLTDQQRELRKRYADTLREGARAGYEQDVANAKGRFAGEVAAALPAAAAAPLTGGASVPVAMGLMGAAGLAGGVAREGTKAAMGSTDLPQSGADLAKTLTLDTALGAAGEGAARAVGKVTLAVAPKLIQRAAALSEKGQKLLQGAFVDTNQQLYSQIQSKAIPLVDVGHELSTATQAIKDLPRAVGQTGQRFGNMTSAASDIVQAFESDLALGGGGVATKQPLDGLIRAHRSMQTAVYHDKGLAVEERELLQRAADGIGKKIRSALASDPKALQLYESAQQLYKTQVQRDIGVKLAEDFLSKQARGHMTAFGVGTAVGAEMLGQSSAWALEKAMAHPQAAALVKRSINMALTGDKMGAKEAMGRAFVMAGVREQVKDWLKESSKIQSPIKDLQSQQPAPAGLFAGAQGKE